MEYFSKYMSTCAKYNIFETKIFSFFLTCTLSSLLTILGSSCAVQKLFGPKMFFLTLRDTHVPWNLPFQMFRCQCKRFEKIMYLILQLCQQKFYCIWSASHVMVSRCDAWRIKSELLMGQKMKPVHTYFVILSHHGQISQIHPNQIKS